MEFTGSFCGVLVWGEFNNCFATGIVKSPEGNAGGFCNYASKGYIRNCYSMCSVTAKRYVSSFIIEYYSSYSNYGSCYATGKAKGSEILQPFGINNGEGSCFWDVETSGIPDTIPDDYAKGLPTSEMMKRSTFAGWDFDKIWCIDEGKDYPKLRAFGNCPTDVEPNNLKTDELMIDAFPNPLSNYTEIRYSIPRSSSVTIKIYNVFGVQVKEVLNEAFHKDGSYKVTINAFDFPAGIYFVTLKAGREMLTKPIIIQK